MVAPPQHQCPSSGALPLIGNCTPDDGATLHSTEPRPKAHSAPNVSKAPQASAHITTACSAPSLLPVGPVATASGTSSSGAGREHDRSARSFRPNGLLCNHRRQGRGAALIRVFRLRRSVPLSRQGRGASLRVCRQRRSVPLSRQRWGAATFRCGRDVEPCDAAGAPEDRDSSARLGAQATASQRV